MREKSCLTTAEIEPMTFDLDWTGLDEVKFVWAVKGKWQQNFLSSHLKETPKQYIKVYYRIFISALFGEIF